MAALPYMPLFVADYLADTAHLTAAQHGAYMLLIMNYWQRGGPLPDDNARLARIARVGPREWGRMRDMLSEFFSVADGAWSHSRVDTELARVTSKSLKSKKAAQASVQRRFGNRSTSVEPTDTDTSKEKTKPKGLPKAVQTEKLQAVGSCLRRAFPKQPIPDDWLPSEFALGSQSRRVIDGWPPGELEVQLEQFKAFHRSKGNTFLDPQDAWSTWTLNTRKFGVGKHERHGEDPTTAAVRRIIGAHP